jgi:DNA-binding LacI/PurR family transcriptional regulator
MQRQVEMENSFLRLHREFMNNLEESINLLQRDLNEAAEMESICTDEWCQATEHVIDELHKLIYSVSEPRWLSKEDHQRLEKIRNRVKDLYVQFRTIKQ